MSTPDDPTEHDPAGGDATGIHDDLDEMARRAGAELGRPAPSGGVALVQRSVRRRRTTATVGSGLAVAALVVGGIALAGRGGGDTVVTDDPVPTTAVPQPTAVPGTTVPPGSSVPPDTTEVAGTTAPPETSSPPETTVPPVPGTTVPPTVTPSDEVLPDPFAFAADGFERLLDGRSLIVRSDPEVVIPLDLPEADLHLYGVGPNGVAYLRAEDFPTVRVLAVPTTGPTAGTVYVLAGPYEHDGPWLGFMTPEGIDPFSNTGGPGIVPYVDPDGQPLTDPIDPTFTWRTVYRLLDDGTGEVQPVLVADDGTPYEVPTTERGREGQFDRAIRPLPDGRPTITILGDDGIAQVWVLDLATASWTVHPRQ